MNKILYFDTINSTQTYARKHYQQITEDTLVHADVQTHGTGRRGSTWESLKDNFHGTFILKNRNIPAKNSGQLAFVIVVAIADYLATIHIKNIRFKWPNDIVIQDKTTNTIKKLGGILIENMGADILIGLGLNLISAPKNLKKHPTICLNDLHKSASENFDTESLFKTLQASLQLYQEEGFSFHQDAWLKQCAHLNKRITLYDGRHGIFKGIKNSGDAILEQLDS